MSGWSRVSLVLRDPRVAAGAALLLLVAGAALFAPLLAPHDPNDQDLLNTLLPPFWDNGGTFDYPLGTDALGRCVLSRLLYGARIALLVGFSASLGAGIVGGVLALIAGYCGGWTDWIISRLIDVWMSFPAIVLALVLIVGLSPSVANAIFAIILVAWTRVCRVTRAEILSLIKRDYIAAARIAGASHLQVVLYDVLPGALPILLTLLSLELGIAVVIEAVLSFTGYAVGPNISTWGGMIADGLVTMFQQPTGLIWPMASIVVTVLGANLLGEGLRRQLDPRLLRRTELQS